jgi:hypothetical protein
MRHAPKVAFWTRSLGQPTFEIDLVVAEVLANPRRLCQPTGIVATQLQRERVLDRRNPNKRCGLPRRIASATIISE